MTATDEREITESAELAEALVAEQMQAVADAFTAGIAQRPEDWHMLGRIWADVPPDPPSRGERA